MNKNQLFEEISERIASVLPMAESAGIEIKAKIDATVKRAMADMDILTREEFAAQAAALAKAEARIDELEKTLAKLEGEISAGKQV
jgi:BMFP domain-containing protein YqiC